MKKHYYPPQAEDFKLVRLSCCLSQNEAADLLHVTLKTVKNWEKGCVAVPYSAFKLLKVLGHYELPNEAFEGWSVNRGKLWSPTGRSFTPHELLYVANYFSMARFWLAEREEMRLRRIKTANTAPLRLVIGGKSA